MCEFCGSAARWDMNRCLDKFTKIHDVIKNSACGLVIFWSGALIAPSLQSSGTNAAVFRSRLCAHKLVLLALKLWHVSSIFQHESKLVFSEDTVTCQT